MHTLTIGKTTFEWGRRTYVMGIVNVTPDSFSGDGLLRAGGHWVDAAIAQARQMFTDGADIIDVGGESTRPGSQPVSVAEQIQRVVPVIERIAAEGLGPISIDAYRAEVVRAALDAGANLVNDVWGLKHDSELGKVAAAAQVPIVLMHNRSRTENVMADPRLGSIYQGAHYANLIADVMAELTECIDLAHTAGIRDENILLDPGIGFGKTIEHNLELIDRLGELRELGYPLLVGTSRKGFIGRILDLPPDHRVEGTAATVAIAIVRGADIVRVHDVAALVRVARMADAIVRRQAG